jgi:DNA helicase HerA-like ATPase
VVRLIRSKGVGVYFVTQNPLDVPDKVLAQLGNRVQHALRAFTPRDQKAVRAAAETFRPNPKLNTAQVITELGKGEALVSFLEGNGTPSMVDRTLIRPPSARVGPVSAEERKAIIAKSPLKGKYDTPVDPESAFEILQKRVGGGAGGEPAQAGEGGGILGTLGGLGGWLGSIFGGGASGARRGRMSTSEVVAKQMARSVASKVGNEVGRAIVRGVLGSLGGKGR